MAWLAVGLFFHACILFPLTVFVNAMSGNSMALLMIGILALVIMLVTNLSQMTMKIVVPATLGSVLVDLLIIIICLAEGPHIYRLFDR